MTTDMRSQAAKLANRPYDVRVMQDETTEGHPIFLALNPELPHCIAQGKTVEEALRNLEDARFEYILSLLQDSLGVPEPAILLTVTDSSDGITEPIQEYVVTVDEPDFSRVPPRVARLLSRQQLFEVSLRT